MKIGVPKEIKNNEYRVGLTPANVRELFKRGHSVLVETRAGIDIGFTDELYRIAGATIAENASEVFGSSDLIIKVKEPQPEECQLLRKNQVLFAFLHLAALPSLTEKLIASGCIAIACETVTDAKGDLPILTPMSEIAGRLSIQEGAHCLLKNQGGRGVLLGGIAGVEPATVIIIGGGAVGTEACKMAVGYGAHVIVFDKSIQRLRELDKSFDGRISTCYSNQEALEQAIVTADLVVGAVLVPGDLTPKILTLKDVRTMKPGSVLVDVSIDQGGCFETSHPTTYSDPTYIKEGIVHYCVTNMPAGVPYTATLAFNNAIFPYIVEIADKGYKKALLENPYLMTGLNIYEGRVTHSKVAKACGLAFTEPQHLL